MDRDPTVAAPSDATGTSSRFIAFRRRLLRGNGHIIAAVLFLAVFGAEAFSVALNTETAMARILGQRGSEGLREITIEFEHGGEAYVVTDSFDAPELAEGQVVQVWFDGDDPDFVEFSHLNLFLGFYVIIGGALIYLAIAVVLRIRRRAPS